jgi:hypothetical protein
MIKYFRPQSDITTFELALVVAHAIPKGNSSLYDGGIVFSEEQWAKLGLVQRHFTDGR